MAMVGVALVFIADDLKRLERHRTARLVIAAGIFLVGLLAVVSNSKQKADDKNKQTATVLPSLRR
jgi:hypothetical protein